jgi:hypothetical protein
MLPQVVASFSDPGGKYGQNATGPHVIHAEKRHLVSRFKTVGRRI